MASRDNSYRQLISTSTTDNHTTIDHIYTNIPSTVKSGTVGVKV